MSQLEQQLESVPGYDLAMDKYNDWAGEKFNNTNPFQDKQGNRRVLDPQKNTEKERRVFRRLQKQAWVHDNCMLGSCGVGLNFGVGLAPVLVFFLPGLGAILTYAIHARVVTTAQHELYLPAKLVAQLQANILLDFLISLPPVLGGFLAWLNGCSTRNAGTIYVYLLKLGEKRASGKAPVYVGPVEGGERRVQPEQVANAVGKEEAKREVRKPERATRGFGKKQQDKVVIGSQQSGIR